MTCIRRARGWLLILTSFVAASLAPLEGHSAADTGAGELPVRIAFSQKMLPGVKVDDARAALQLLCRDVANATGMKLPVGNGWLMTSEQLLSAIRAGTVDIFGLTVEEYSRVAAHVDTSRMVTNDYGGDELLLVVRQGSGIAQVADLAGRSVTVLDSPVTTLAEMWLAVSLRQAGLKRSERVPALIRETNLSHVVLPLFFGQADACVVTRRGLKEMMEMNPQLSRKLKIVLESPRIMNGFLASRLGYPPRLRNLLFERLVDPNLRPSLGRMLAFFQTPGIIQQNGECLQSALSILELYERSHESTTGRGR